ncbi:MAG: hypothetical protein PSU94_12015 [Lacunisphaera sp.]|nr:hypothetical protein [Lacunisphaera sp.]
MSRAYFLELAARHLRMPIGADLGLHQHHDPAALLLDGARLGDVIAEAAVSFGTPLADARASAGRSNPRASSSDAPTSTICGSENRGHTSI